MSNAEHILACLEAAVALGRAKQNLTAYRMAKAVVDLGKIARQLHRRYEASCSYEWATTHRYQSRTDRLEDRATTIAAQIDVTVEFQRDPRGWPLILRFGDNELRLGG